MTGPRQCPRWENCSAPVCPLAPEWEQFRHLDDERVCGLLCELAKDGGEARLRGALPATLVDRLAEVAPKIEARHYPIRKRLRLASRTGSRIEAGQALARRKGGAVEVLNPQQDARPNVAARATVPPLRDACGGAP